MQNSLTNVRGTTLFMVLVYVQIMLLVVLHTLSFLSLLRPISRNDQERMRLHYIAEAGVFMTAESILKEPGNYALREYRIEDAVIQVMVEARGTDEVWMMAAANSSSRTTRLWATMNKTTGKITNWSEFKIDN